VTLFMLRGAIAFAGTTPCSTSSLFCILPSERDAATDAPHS
jgi:hypothetical protein